MSIGIAAFLVGVFLVPLVLLLVGHRLRRHSRRVQNAFWGGVLGHCIALVAAVIIAMIPPESWTSGETLRGAAGFWGMTVLPLLGAVLGAIRPPRVT